MYHLIDNHIAQILDSIKDDHISKYDWLVQNIQQIADPCYQKKYKSFWRLNRAGLCQDYCSIYFQKLQEGLNGNPPLIETLANELYHIPTRNDGSKALQFSFCSKLCHMLNRQIPIYDSKVRIFYDFVEPIRELPVEQRIEGYVWFHQFLSNEYNRVLNEGLLAQSIQAFRCHFKPQHFTDIKVIDSLIWAYKSYIAIAP